MAEIIHLNRDPVMTCSKCQCQRWFVHLDDVGLNYEYITRFECIDCGGTINIDLAAVSFEGRHA